MIGVFKASFTAKNKAKAAIDFSPELKLSELITNFLVAGVGVYIIAPWHGSEEFS